MLSSLSRALTAPRGHKHLLFHLFFRIIFRFPFPHHFLPRFCLFFHVLTRLPPPPSHPTPYPLAAPSDHAPHPAPLTASHNTSSTTSETRLCCRLPLYVIQDCLSLLSFLTHGRCRRIWPNHTAFAEETHQKICRVVQYLDHHYPSPGGSRHQEYARRLSALPVPFLAGDVLKSVGRVTLLARAPGQEVFGILG